MTTELLTVELRDGNSYVGPLLSHKLVLDGDPIDIHVVKDVQINHFHNRVAGGYVKLTDGTTIYLRNTGILFDGLNLSGKLQLRSLARGRDFTFDVQNVVTFKLHIVDE